MITTGVIPPKARIVPRPVILTRREQYLVRHRCQTLGVAVDVVNACHTMGELRPAVKRAYRQLAAHYHPDHARLRQRELQARGHGYAAVYYNNGRRFCLLTSAYGWLMAIPAEALLHWRPMPVHELRAWLQALEPMSELPGVIERPHPAMGAGWQEVAGWR